MLLLMQGLGLLQQGEQALSCLLSVGGEKEEDPIPAALRTYLSILNMSEAELDNHIAAGPDKFRLSSSAGDELGIYTLFIMLLDEARRSLEESDGAHSLEHDISILEKGPDSVIPEVWACVLYRAGQKRIVRGYRKAAMQKLDKIVAQMNSA